MAQIITYPKLSTLANNDLLLISDVSSANKTTNSVELQTLANFIVTSTSGVTGSGILNTIAMFTPDGQSIGDSIITQDAFGQGVTIDGNLEITATNTLTVETIQAQGTGAVYLLGGVQIGDAPGDILNIFSETAFFGKIKDSTFSTGTAGQILVSNATSNVEWTDIADISGAVTGTGTTNTLPLWSDGPNGVLDDSLITQASLGQAINVNTNLFVSDDLNVTGSIETNSNLTVNGTTTTVADVSIGANAITNTPGFASMAAGNINTVLSGVSFAFGYGNTANAFAAFAGGGGSQTNGIAAISYGNNNQANGSNSVAFGSYATASGDQSFAAGDGSTASGQNSMALGGDALAQDSLAGPGVTVNTADYAGFKNLLLANYAGLNYASDAAAAAGGVPLGGIYHDAGKVKIRLV